MQRFALGFIAISVAVSFAACGKYFSWKQKPAASAMTGKVVVEVADKRDPEHGGKDTRIIGLEPGAFAIPVEIKLGTATEAADTVREVFSQAAQSAGVGVAPVGTTGVPKVTVDIANMWCAGFFPVFKASFIGNVSVVGADGSVRVQPTMINIDDGDAGCQGAYRKLLTKLYGEAQTMMEKPEVKEAAK